MPCRSINKHVKPMGVTMNIMPEEQKNEGQSRTGFHLLPLQLCCSLEGIAASSRVGQSTMPEARFW